VLHQPALPGPRQLALAEFFRHTRSFPRLSGTAPNIICDTNSDYWLIDFGIARHLTLSSLTATGAMWGRLTFGYAPREQMRNEKLEIDSRADLFALGITIIESYTGNNPFRDGAISNLEIVQRVEGLSISNPFLGNQLEIEFGDLVCTMLQKRRDLRPRNASTTLQWLTEIETRHGAI
jgi:serine/threonine-protein kinase